MRGPTGHSTLLPQSCTVHPQKSIRWSSVVFSFRLLREMQRVRSLCISRLSFDYSTDEMTHEAAQLPPQRLLLPTPPATCSSSASDNSPAFDTASGNTTVRFAP